VHVVCHHCPLQYKDRPENRTFCKSVDDMESKDEEDEGNETIKDDGDDDR